MDNLPRLIKTVFKKFATLGYLGYLPAAGTIGSICGILFFLLFKPSLKVIILILLLSLLAIIITLNQTSEKDPKYIIIDEFIAVVLSCAVLPSLTTKYYIYLFFLFRIFDIAKPWPIKQLEKLPGPWGVIIDDLLAGGLASLIIYLIINKQTLIIQAY
jgi:phosphatidylglycerophosphatase A